MECKLKHDAVKWSSQVHRLLPYYPELMPSTFWSFHILHTFAGDYAFLPKNSSYLSQFPSNELDSPVMLLELFICRTFAWCTSTESRDDKFGLVWRWHGSCASVTQPTSIWGGPSCSKAYSSRFIQWVMQLVSELLHWIVIYPQGAHTICFDCYFIVNVLDLPFASPVAMYR